MKDYSESLCYVPESCGVTSPNNSYSTPTSTNPNLASHDALVSNIGVASIVVAIATGVISSLLTTAAINIYNKLRARRILLKSKRFMEALEESHDLIRISLEKIDPILDYYGGIEWFHFPGKRSHKVAPEYYEDQATATKLIEMYNAHKPILATIIGIIKSDKNDVIYDTIDKSLSVHYDQQLMNISGDLKNRSHNFTDDIFGNLENIPNNNASLIYYTFFHALAYCSYVFDLLKYLKIENKLDEKYKSAKIRLKQKEKRSPKEPKP